SHENDYHVLNKILTNKFKPKYMGMLCSPDKIKSYLEKTYQTFGKEINLSNFYAPIGLQLGGNSPEDIAISISSEILAVYHDKQDIKHMREMLSGDDCYW
ncbi:MAG: XdhC/CoxF family protein, partial [Erysipelotrichia bacterium]|nr:XdhC/CoxF family protein [Erysipelotrichia bacterium]